MPDDKEGSSVKGVVPIEYTLPIEHTGLTYIIDIVQISMNSKIKYF